MDDQNRKNRDDGERALQNEKTEKLCDAALTGAVTDTARRFGGAVSAYETAYNGYDPESGRTYDKSLKRVGSYRIDPGNPQRSYQQHAGFSAEILENAERNAEHAVNDDGKKSARTDDLDHSDSRYDGYGANDQYVDLVELDENGNPITDSETQMKFVGNSPEACLDKLASRKFEKYLKRGVRLMIPKDYYKEVMAEADRRIESLQEQLEHAKENGNSELAKKLEAEIERYQQIKDSLIPSRLSKKEAVFAAKHPKAATGIRIGETTLRAGVQGAATGAAFGGTVSIVRNLAAYERGEITREEACRNVAKDTARSSGEGFVTASEGALLTGILENSKHETMQKIASTNAPVMMVQAVRSSYRIMKQYSEGKIDAAECTSLLCESAVSSGAQAAVARTASSKAASMITAKIGSLKVGSAIGGALGGISGYLMANVTLRALREARSHYHEARQYRIEMEEACGKRIAEMEDLQEQIRTAFDQTMRQAEQGICQANALMDSGMEQNDAFTCLEGISVFRRTMDLPGEVMTPSEFEIFLKSGQPLAL